MDVKLWHNSNAMEQRQVLDALPVLVFLERAGCIVFANAEAVQVMGRAEPEWLNRPIDEVIWGLSAGSAEPQTSLISRKGSTFHATLATGSGRILPVEGTYQVLHTDRREGVIVAQLSERERRNRPQLMEQVLACIPEAIAIVMGGKVMYTNPAFTQMFGFPADEIAGESLQDVIVPETRQHEQVALERLAEERGLAAVDTMRLRKDGELLDVALHMAPLTIAGMRAGYVFTHRDIGERKQVESRVLQDATHDALTGLPNDVLFRDRLKLALSRQARRPEQRCGVLLLEVDGFRELQASLGHAGADQLLTVMASRLQNVLRPHDTAARTGEDNFAILAEGIATPADLEAVAARVLSEFEKPMSIFGNSVEISIRIGAAMPLRDSESLDALMANADIALHRAKQSGGHGYEIYERHSDVQLADNATRERALRNALARGEFDYWYQPFFRLQTGQVEGFETLLRDRQTGPGNFRDLLAAAENTGLSVTAGGEIMQNAWQRLQHWNAAIPGGRILLAVPVTRRHLYHESLIEIVEQLALTELADPTHLMLDVSESAISENPQRAQAILQRISACGVGIALSDFGASAGALQYLVQLPISMVKIDPGLTQNPPPSSRAMALLEAILHVTKAAGIRTLAQGIDREDQFHFVQSMGFESGQGDLLSAPLSTENAEMLAARSLGMTVVKNTRT
jgi:diguanylate cyclase (GGDEF)-like protein/PAS domain S-box-containing protein